MTHIGVDPGLSGAIAVLDANGATVHDMPTYVLYKSAAVKRAVDLTALASLLRPLRDGTATMHLERVNAMPGQGVASMFSLGMSLWGAAGVAAGLGVPVRLVEPAAWKRHFGLGRDKEEARALAQRLFPGVELSRKKDHGRAEALLIARYGKETTK